jgi:hypothetical protein
MTWTPILYRVASGIWVLNDPIKEFKQVTVYDAARWFRPGANDCYLVWLHVINWREGDASPWKITVGEPPELMADIEAAGQPSSIDTKPTWDGRELRFGGVLCLSLTKRARNQTTILDTFKECNWDIRIDSPWKPGDPKLKRTIDDLNRALRESRPPSPLRFAKAGDGVRWETAGDVP